MADFFNKVLILLGVDSFGSTMKKKQVVQKEMKSQFHTEKTALGGFKWQYCGETEAESFRKFYIIKEKALLGI